jgi:hypothetical protein
LRAESLLRTRRSLTGKPSNVHELENLR